MNNLYMGLDVGVIYTKGIIIDDKANILASSYIETLGEPVKAAKKVIKDMEKEIDLNKYRVISLGVTGSARKLVGSLLSANTIRNEITSLVEGCVKLYPNVRTIMEIGGEDSKAIILEDGIIKDYAICKYVSGSYVNYFTRMFGIDIKDVNDMAMKGKSRIDALPKCMMFLENDLSNKMQSGYKKEDVLRNISLGIARGYVNSFKDMINNGPIMFCGGVSRNKVVVNEIEKMLDYHVIVNRNSHIMGALGIAILAKKEGKYKEFDFNICNYKMDTKIHSCLKCNKQCEIVSIYRDDKLIDYWGNKCNDSVKEGNLVV